MRKRNTMSDPVLCNKPNRFPRARFGNIVWSESCRKQNADTENGENEGNDGDTNSAGSSIDALRSRFDEPDTGCPGTPAR